MSEHDYCRPSECVRQYDLPRLARRVSDWDGSCKAATELLDASMSFRSEAFMAERDSAWMAHLLTAVRQRMEA